MSSRPALADELESDLSKVSMMQFRCHHKRNTSVSIRQKNLGSAFFFRSSRWAMLLWFFYFKNRRRFFREFSRIWWNSKHLTRLINKLARFFQATKYVSSRSFSISRTLCRCVIYHEASIYFMCFTDVAYFCAYVIGRSFSASLNLLN